MAIDPSIITAGMRQPEQVDPMGVLGKVLTLRNQQGQAQAQQQEAQLRGQAIQENDLKIAGMNRAASGRQALTTILQNPESYDPTTAQPKHAQVAQQLAQAGFSDEAEAWLKQSSTNAEALEKLRSTAQAHSEAAQEAIGGLAATAQSPQEFDASLGLLATHGVLDPKMAQQIASEADAAGPDGWKAFRDKYVHLAPSSRKAALENADALQKPTKLGPGENLVIPATGTTVATGGSNSTKETKSVLLDGKPSELVFDNKSSEYTLGKQVIDPSRIRPIPPASIQVNTAASNALANLPTWATDASRPAGADANKIDPAVRMTPNGLYQAAQTYIATGQFPQTGRGNDPGAQAVRAAVTSKVGAIAAESGMDEPALRAFYKANSASLTQTQKSYDAVQSFMGAADKNAALLQTALKKVPDTGIPIFNQPLRNFEKNVAGNPDLAPFATYLRSVTNEYGKIIAQPNLSGQLTDSARKEAEDLLDPKATVQQIIGTVQALTNEGTNRLTSLGDQIKTIQGRMSAGAGQPQAAATPARGIAAPPKDGTEGLVNGVPAVWKTVNGKSGWYAK